MGFKSYADYLKSKMWKEIVDQVKKRDKNCRFCGKNGYSIHHGIYALQGYNLREVYLCCGKCHYELEFTKAGIKRRFSVVRKLTKERLTYDD